jgi:hypothetical protein
MNDDDVIVPLKPLSDEKAIAFLRTQGSSLTHAALAQRWGWERSKVTRRLQAWEKAGYITRDGDTLVVTDSAPSEPVGAPMMQAGATMHQALRKPSRALVHQPMHNIDCATEFLAPNDAPGGAPSIAPKPAPTIGTQELGAVGAAPGARRWRAIGRVTVGAAIVGTGAWIAYTSMRGNAWFGHSLTPDPAAGEIYSDLSVAAELMACLIPTAIRFYWTGGEPWSAVRGWALMVVALVVVFFAAGGFAITNINSGMEARAERQTADIVLAERKLDTLSKSRADECRKRGPECASLDKARVEVKASADPQAAALGISSATLHLVQGGAMVALCLFSGLFISFGAGLIWTRGRAA